MPDQKYYDMIPPEINHILAEIFELGDKGRGYGPGSWAEQSWMYHLGKAIGHIGKFFTGSREEPHMSCAMWRMCIATVLYWRAEAE